MSMATIRYIGQREFSSVVPGDPRIHSVAWPINDESIWQQVSGEWVRIGDVPHILYRHAGQLFLRISEMDTRVDDQARSEFQVADGRAILRIHNSTEVIEVIEPVPAWLVQNPTTDDMTCEDHLWTYRVHGVLSNPDGRRLFWGLNGW